VGGFFLYGMQHMGSYGVMCQLTPSAQINGTDRGCEVCLFATRLDIIIIIIIIIFTLSAQAGLWAA
jgi:hypothetical protein